MLPLLLLLSASIWCCFCCPSSKGIIRSEFAPNNNKPAAFCPLLLELILLLRSRFSNSSSSAKCSKSSQINVFLCIKHSHIFPISTHPELPFVGVPLCSIPPLLLPDLQQQSNAGIAVCHFVLVASIALAFCVVDLFLSNCFCLSNWETETRCASTKMASLAATTVTESPMKHQKLPKFLVAFPENCHRRWCRCCCSAALARVFAR